MHSRLRRALPAAAIGAALLAATASSSAQDIKEHSLKLAHTVALDHPIGVGAKRFSELVAQKSGNKIKIAVHGNSVLGGDNQIVSAARGGSIDFAVFGANGLVPVIKEFMLFDFPFLFDSEQQAQALIDDPVGTKLMNKLPGFGMVGLGVFDSGFRNLTNSRRPITKIEEIDGLKLRVVQSPIYVDMFKELGANPVPLAFSELYSALEQKAVDGQENPVGLIEATKFFEVQKYLTLTRHTYSGFPLIMSKKTWDGLSGAERKVLTDAAREAAAEQRKLSQENTNRALGALKTRMQVIEPAPAEVARMRQKVAPVLEKYSKEIGVDLLKETQAELARMRAAK